MYIKTYEKQSGGWPCGPYKLTSFEKYLHELIYLRYKDNSQKKRCLN